MGQLRAHFEHHHASQLLRPMLLLLLLFKYFIEQANKRSTQCLHRWQSIVDATQQSPKSPQETHEMHKSFHSPTIFHLILNSSFKMMVI